MVTKSEIERLFTWIVPHMAVLLNSLALFEIVSEYFLKFQNVKITKKKFKSRKYECGENSVVVNHIIPLPYQQLPAQS